VGGDKKRRRTLRVWENAGEEKRGGKVRGKLSRELERQKCVQDKRLRCSISRYGPSLLFLCPPLSLHPAFFSFSLHFFAVAYGVSRERCSVSPLFPLSFPLAASLRFVQLPPHVLNYVRSLWHSTTALAPVIISLHPRICYSTSCSPFPFKLAHSCTLIFLPLTDLQM